MEVKVMTNVLAKNDAIAADLQRLFKEKNIFVFNLLAHRARAKPHCSKRPSRSSPKSIHSP